MSPRILKNRKEPVEGARTRASRLTFEELPPEWGSWCREQKPELDPNETWERFRDYWIAKPGQGGAKLDWFATWRNWCRNERLSLSKIIRPVNGTARDPAMESWFRECRLYDEKYSSDVEDTL